jgi:protocatechuate 3,4-dioxygenase beta subunit
MIMESSRKFAKYILTGLEHMSKKHSSEYFRRYFASAMKAEPEATDRVPKKTGIIMKHREAIAETGKIAIAATAALLIVGGGAAGYYSILPSQRQTTTTSASVASSDPSVSVSSMNRTPVAASRASVVPLSLTTSTTVTTATPSLNDASTTTSQSAYIVDPQMTEGPYWVDEELNRSDIRVDPTDGSVQEGAQLLLSLSVQKTTDGASWSPFTGAQVDIWQANYQGVYSDEAAEGTVGRKFLRGYQATDEKGTVRFTTVYPGWYSGRTVHIHLRIRTFDGTQTTFEFTSQLFFDDSVTAEVLSQAPYGSRGLPDTTNAMDRVYTGASTDGTVQSDVGSLLMLTLGKDTNGYTGDFNVGAETSRGGSVQDSVDHPRKQCGPES